MSNEPLDPNSDNDHEKDAGETRVLNIDNLHLHASEIDAIRRLAEVDPDLAKIVVSQKEAFSRREHASYRFGVVSAVLLALGLLFALSYVLVKIGIILSMVLVTVLVALALMIRVILTGEWSDASVIGHVVNGITKALGGKPKHD